MSLVFTLGVLSIAVAEGIYVCTGRVDAAVAVGVVVFAAVTCFCGWLIRRVDRRWDEWERRHGAFIAQVHALTVAEARERYVRSARRGDGSALHHTPLSDLGRAVLRERQLPDQLVDLFRTLGSMDCGSGLVAPETLIFCAEPIEGVELLSDSDFDTLHVLTFHNQVQEYVLSTAEHVACHPSLWHWLLCETGSEEVSLMNGGAGSMGCSSGCDTKNGR